MPKVESTVEKEQPVEQPVNVPEERSQSSQPTGNRKKRSSLPLNLDDYEKRRSARSVSVFDSFSYKSSFLV